MGCSACKHKYPAPAVAVQTNGAAGAVSVARPIGRYRLRRVHPRPVPVVPQTKS